VLKSESIAALAKAIALSQLHVENALKSSTNPHFKSKYADLAEILNTVRPVFSANGIAIVQTPTFESGVASVETMLCHESGEFISSICSSPVSKQDAQGIGSAITYLRRYSLAAMCGVAQEDDDGNGASDKDKPKQPATPKQPPTNQTLAKPTPEVKKLSNDERELGVKDMKAAPDEAALKEALLGWHKAAKDIGDKDSIAFFNDCYHQCAAAFAEY
jgi:hypothetical protein